MSPKGLLLVNKQPSSPSFRIVSMLRRLTGVKKIGHAGTLDPFATGVMVMLIGKEYTKKSDTFLTQDKEYLATLSLGSATTTYDTEGTITSTSPYTPSLEEVRETLKSFQGELFQTPPMFSAKKVGGKRLYELARKGVDVQREAQKVHVEIELIEFCYPKLTLKINCSKGTYIRSLADDIGKKLQCYAHLCALTRTRSGPFHLKDCIDQSALEKGEVDLFLHLRSE